MANRTVSVELTLRTEQYKAEAEAAKLKTESLDRTVVDLDRDINKLPADALKAGAALDLMGAGSKNAADGTGKLDARIAELKTSVRDLGSEFDRTGNPELLKKFRSDSSELAGLTKMRKEFTNLGEEAVKVVSPMEQLAKDAEKFSKESEKAAMSVGDLFGGGIGSPGGIALIGALIPPALALVGGLTTALAGVGVAGAGVMGAIAGNPQAFKAEWGNAIGSIKNDWIAASAPFVGPTLDAIRSVGPLVDSWHIDTMFQKAATFVEPLVHGIEGFATGIEKGVAALVDKAGPEIAVLSADLPKLGDSIGTALSMISNNAEGGAQSLNDLFVAMDKIIITTGALISGAEAVGGALTSADASVKHFLDSIPTWVYAVDPLLLLPRKLADIFTPEPFNTTAGSWGKAFSDLGNIGGSALTTIQDDAAGAAAMLDKMNQSFDRSLSDALGLQRADIQVAQGFADLAKQFKAGSDALDINSQRGRDNVTVIDKIVAGLQKQRDESIKSAGGTKAATDAANAAYDSQLAKLGQMLVKLGNNKAAVDNLLGAFKDKTFTITQKVVSVYSNVGSVSSQGVLAGPVPRAPGSAYAEGGDPPPGMAWTGERGPELIAFRGTEHVFTADQSRAIMAPSSGMLATMASSGRGGGPSSVVVNATVSYNGPTSGLDGFFVGWLAEQSRKGNIQIHAKSVIS